MSGSLTIVGLGPGAPEHRTAAASAAIRTADVVIGYDPYVEQCADLLSERQLVLRGRIGEESERALEAVRRAAADERVALVCSGDPGVYGMAARTLALAAELSTDHRPDVRVLPGVTAALAAAALLGAPLADDFAVLSLSDLQTSWETIERRLAGLAASGIALCLYNPRSRTRTWQLRRALEILGEHRPADTPVNVVADATREGQHVQRATLSTVDQSKVTMTTLLVVGGETASVAGDWTVALR